jgi:hypothetical protein
VSFSKSIASSETFFGRNLMKIKFLDAAEANYRLRNLKLLNLPKIKKCTNLHFNKAISFTEQQKTILTELADYIKWKIINYVEFALLKPGVYWDYPFTYGKTIIVITPKVLLKSRFELLRILAHEYIHLDQRIRPNKYERLYNRLGFYKAKIDYGWLTQYLMHNPDGEKYEWLWTDPCTLKVYAPVSLMINCKFKTFLVEPTPTTLKVYPDKKIPSYWKLFGNIRQICHPNEIVAHLLCNTI